MPLQRRLPKRGFRSTTARFVAEVRLSDLEKLPVEQIDLLALKQAGLVTDLQRSAKVILSGELTRKVTLSGVAATKGAKAAIEAAGGSVADIVIVPVERKLKSKEARAAAASTAAAA